MRKLVITVLVLVSLFLLASTSSCSLIHNQSACTTNRATDEGVELNEDDACEVETDDSQLPSFEAGTAEQAIEEKKGSSLAENALADGNDQETPPIPDGRIYNTPEGPYPYIPTYTPKEPWGIPITPLEPTS